MPTDEFYTVEDVSKILKLKKYTIYEIIKRGELSCTKLGKQFRISKADLERYCNSRVKNPDANPESIKAPPQELSPATNERLKSLSQSGVVIVAGQDFCLDLLLGHITNNNTVFRSFVGAYNGLYELYHRRINMTAVHLWDAETDKYNLPYIRKLLPGIPYGVVRLVGRAQGFYVKKGNPKNILDWGDLSRGDITMINREKGSGTRILLDQKLSALGINPEHIQGYQRESTSNNATANIVARGGADVAIGSQRAGENIQAIDFIPLQNEWYDLAYRKDDENLPIVRQILEIAASPAYREDLEAAGGYDISQTGKKIC